MLHGMLISLVGASFTYELRLELIHLKHNLKIFTVPSTLYNAILRIARNFLETKENIKISTHPFYHVNSDWFSWEWSKKIFFFFLKKKSKMAVFQKWPFFKIANSQNFFMKILQIGPLISWIDWCEGHWWGSTYMAVGLSNISSKTG